MNAPCVVVPSVFADDGDGDDALSCDSEDKPAVVESEVDLEAPSERQRAGSPGSHASSTAPTAYAHLHLAACIFKGSRAVARIADPSAASKRNRCTFNTCHSSDGGGCTATLSIPCPQPAASALCPARLVLVCVP